MKRPRKLQSRTGIVTRLIWAKARRLLPAFLLVLMAVALSLYFLERGEPESKFHGIDDALWFCLVTMSTVGYGDIFPVTEIGRLITGGFILFTLGTVGLLITAVSEAIMEVKHMEDTGLIGTRMTGHVIVCGFNSMARASLHELLAARRPVGLLCETQEELAAARDELRKAPDLFMTTGEPTQEVLRERLNGTQADAFIVAMRDDTKNLIAALNIKVVKPSARLVVALQREELRQTLEAGGVTYIASPNELSGRLVASAAFEPEVAMLLEDLMSAAVGTSDMQQYQAGELGGRSVRDVRAKLAEVEGPLLVAVAKKNGDQYDVLPNPPRDLLIDRLDHLIMIATDEQAERFEERYKLRQGR